MASLNIKNRSLFIYDNLDILRGLNNECVDLIYLDPPFNSNRSYSAPIGSKAAGASFKDAWTLDDIDLAWIGQLSEYNPNLMELINAIGVVGGKGDKSYLVFMAMRLLEMHRVLKPTGSIYLHCDPTMSHSLKLLLDCIFGESNYRNEVIWCYSRPSAPKQRQLSRVHDTIFWYSKGKTWTFNSDDIRQPYAQSSIDRDGYSANASKVAIGNVELNKKGKFPESWIYVPPLKGNSKESTGYPTQKPLMLLERIIKASSNEGDVILDPFCGCATAMVAAERLNRKWIGIDISDVALNLIKDRLKAEENLYTKNAWDGIIDRRDIPARTDNKKTIINPKEYKHTLYGVQAGICKGCKNHFQIQNMTLDHILPQSKGGQDIKDNLQLLCGNCNSIKGNRPMEYLVSEVKTRYG